MQLTPFEQGVVGTVVGAIVGAAGSIVAGLWAARRTGRDARSLALEMWRLERQDAALDEFEEWIETLRVHLRAMAPGVDEDLEAPRRDADAAVSELQRRWAANLGPRIHDGKARKLYIELFRAASYTHPVYTDLEAVRQYAQ